MFRPLIFWEFSSGGIEPSASWSNLMLLAAPPRVLIWKQNNSSVKSTAADKSGPKEHWLFNPPPVSSFSSLFLLFCSSVIHQDAKKATIKHTHIVCVHGSVIIVCFALYEISHLHSLLELKLSIRLECELDKQHNYSLIWWFLSHSHQIYIEGFQIYKGFGTVGLNQVTCEVVAMLMRLSQTWSQQLILVYQ